MSSRIQNTKRNIIWSYADYFITIIFSFVSRTIIVQVLGAEYLGLSSLFTSILQVLNMAELGFSAAIVYNMYKPLAENDTETVCALLAFYKRIYHYIGFAVLAIGLIATPFIHNLIVGGWPNDINIYFLYLLYLLNTSISYFLFAYKTSLLNALQRMDLTKIAYCIVNIIQCGLQLVSLLILKNYYMFVISTIIGTSLKNFFVAYIAKKKYPQYTCKGEVSLIVRKSIFKRVKGLLICNISGVTYTTFDSIVLSSFLGLTSVAIYNNYLTILNAVSNVIILIRHSMQASVGNSVASESREKNYCDLMKWQFLFSSIATWCSTCLLCLYQPFMRIWMGEDMLLSLVDVILLSISFFVSTVQHAFFLYLTAAGMWLEMKWVYIYSAVCNIILNLVLCRILGITGIILATLTAGVVFGTIWQCAIVLKRYFGKRVTMYLFKQLLYFGIAGLSGGVCYIICQSIWIDGIGGLIVRFVICSIVPFVFIVLTFRHTVEFNNCKNLAKRFM